MSTTKKRPRSDTSSSSNDDDGSSNNRSSSNNHNNNDETTIKSNSNQVYKNLIHWVHEQKNSWNDNDSTVTNSTNTSTTTTTSSSVSYFIHTDLGLQSLSSSNNNNNNNDRYTQYHRTLQNCHTTNTISNGTLVLRIPTISIWNFDISSSIMELLHSTSLEQRQRQDDSISKTMTNDWKECMTDINEEYILAWYLAQKPHHIHPYLDSIPKHINIPRLWSSSTIQRLLYGSPVNIYIQQSISNIQQQYDRLVQVSSMEYDSNQTTTIIPSWEEYSYAHAIITSRSFTCSCHNTSSSDYTKNSDIVTCDPITCTTSNTKQTNKYMIVPSLCLIPILDLCNHSRGINDTTKNISYTFQMEPLSNSPLKQESMMMMIAANAYVTQDILPQESIRITYGAKPNSVLFVNYGFTIWNNIEPDGSSNDILEFYNHTNIIPYDIITSTASLSTPIVIAILRTGPPSYTYGCFTTILQWFQHNNINNMCTTSNNNNNTTNHGSDNQDNDDDDDGDDDDAYDMDTFLNDCDQEEHDHNDENDVIWDIDDVSNTNNDTKKSTNTYVQELAALQQFHQRLIQLANDYSLPKQTNFTWTNIYQQSQNPMNSRTDTTICPNHHDWYASILIHSELRIIQFYIWTIERLASKISQIYSIMNIINPISKTVVPLLSDDMQRINQQIDDLISVYIRLRHS